MIYKNKDIPSNFNKIAEVGDNYIVFVKDNNIVSGRNYEAYIQFFNPSWAYFYTTTYNVKSSSSDVNYHNNGYYNYIDNINTSSSYNTYSIDNSFITTEDSERADVVSILLGQILCVACILWVFKQFSYLWHKGGMN